MKSTYIRAIKHGLMDPQGSWRRYDTAGLSSARSNSLNFVIELLDNAGGKLVPAWSYLRLFFLEFP
jgi:hypothetical protein